jgi:predicted ATP-binding protein involved in virulence
VRIDKIQLQHYRGAYALSLDLNKTLNIFYGVNGSGKSTVLKSIAIMLSWVVSRLRHSGTSGQFISNTDITNGKNYSIIMLSCSSQGKNIEWQLAKTRQGHIASNNRSNFNDLNDFTKQLQVSISENEERVNLPIFVYYPVDRAVLDIPLRIRGKHSFQILTTYADALGSGTNFRTFFEWFREREDLENENRKYINSLIKPENFCFPDRQLEAVRNALQQFLPEFENLTVRRNPLRMEVTKNGSTLTINQLSDGEKCLIAMVGDLARRMAIANALRENPLHGEGIVLIDEIDLHLHPKWQRIVVSKLIEVFPNCQFTISTHSPNVITHVHPNNLYLLEQTEAGTIAKQPSESYGKTVDRILEDLMGLTTSRPDKVNTNLHKIYELISLGQIVEAKESVAIMKGEIQGDPDLVIGADPELVKAEILIKRREIIGR